MAAQVSSTCSSSLLNRLIEVFVGAWDLGFTAFGGPPVHFQILYRRFVDGQGAKRWIDDQAYQELFAVCQALPGPASTKLLFCIALQHAGLVPATLVFLLWSLPGATVMYGLSLGVQQIDENLPPIVYALLSGLNASTVGIIALAAMQLAEKAIKDKLSRGLVIFGACAGVCYNALWYFPTLMVIGGLSTFAWDGHLRPRLMSFRRRQRGATPAETSGQPDHEAGSVNLERNSVQAEAVQRRAMASSPEALLPSQRSHGNATVDAGRSQEHVIRLRAGLVIVSLFICSFIVIIVIRGVVNDLPMTFSLFSNMFLAGTIIFGGGPVVIPLLRSYVVDPGWVSSRDFLIGLAIIQALPGPNFNFAVFLGALALQRAETPTFVGSMLAFIGIFAPGIALAVAMQGFWRIMRTRQWVLQTLRGIHATAVGLVFTAVYRLWGIGYLTAKVKGGQSLAANPWWVVVTTLTYAETAWYGVPPPIAIVTGAILGLGWYGVVGR